MALGTSLPPVAPSERSRVRPVAALALTVAALFASCKDPSLPDRAPGPDAALAVAVVVLPPVPSIAPTATATTEKDASADAADSAQPAPKVLVVRNEPTKLAGGQVIAGPCVTPSMAAAAKSADAGLPLDEDFFSPIANDLDLDGDGAHDFVLNGGASRTTVTMLLYLRRGDCGYDVGAIDVEGAPELLTTKTRGLADIRVVQDLCQSKTGTSRCDVVYKFDGRRYRPSSYKARAGGGGIF